MHPSPFLVPPSVSTYVADRVWLKDFNQSSSSSLSVQHQRNKNYHQNSRAATYSRLAFRAEKVRYAQVIESICTDSAVRVVWDEDATDVDVDVDDIEPTLSTERGVASSVPPPRPSSLSSTSLTDTIRFLHRLNIASRGGGGGVEGSTTHQPASSSSSSLSTRTTTTVQNDPLLAIGAHNLFVDAPFRLWFTDDRVEVADWGEVEEVWDARDQLNSSPNVVNGGRPVLMSRLVRPIPTYTFTTATTTTTATSSSLQGVNSTPFSSTHISSPTQRELTLAQERRASLVVEHRLLILQVGSSTASRELNFAQRRATLAKIETAKQNDGSQATAAGRIHLHLVRVFEESGYGEGNTKRDSSLSVGNSYMSAGAAHLESSEASTIHLMNVLAKDNEKLERGIKAVSRLISRAHGISSNILSLDVEIERMEAIITEEERVRSISRNIPLSDDGLCEEITKDESVNREGIESNSFQELDVLMQHHANALTLYRSHASSLLAHLDTILTHRLADFVVGVGGMRMGMRSQFVDGYGSVTFPTQLLAPYEYHLTNDEEAALARIHAREGFSFTPPPSSPPPPQRPSRGVGGGAEGTREGSVGGGGDTDADDSVGGGTMYEVNSVQHLQDAYQASLRTSFGRRLCCAEQTSSYIRLKKVHEALHMIQLHWRLFQAKDLSSALINDPCFIIGICRDTLKLIDEIHNCYYFAEDCPLPGTEGITRLCPPVPDQISENEVDEIMTRNMFVMHSVVRWGVSVPFNGRLATLVCRFNLHGCVVSYRRREGQTQQQQRQ